MAVTVWTVGHSNRSFEAFAVLLERAAIELLIDVRAFPGSRKHPQFGRDLFPGLLEERGIAYEHVPGLGGRRRYDPDGDPAVSGAWRNLSFRAYAQYAQTPEFDAALDAVVARAADVRLVICCSEAVPWRCHRWLVSDVLVARGHEVRHLISDGAARPHRLVSFARVRDARVTWPASDEQTGPAGRSIDDVAATTEATDAIGG